MAVNQTTEKPRDPKSPRPEGLVIPKVESREQRQWVSRQTSSLPPVIQTETVIDPDKQKQIAAGASYAEAFSSAQ